MSYGTADVDSSRFVAASDALGSGSAVAKATAGGRQPSGVLAGGFDWQLGPWTFGPHVGAYCLDTQIGRLDESGAGSFDLSVGDQPAKSLRLNAGAQLGVALRLPWIVLTPRLDADYMQDLDDRNETIEVHLAPQPLGSVADPLDAALRVPRADAGYFTWSVGASARWTKLVSAFVSYQTYAGADTPTAKALTSGLRFEILEVHAGAPEQESIYATRTTTGPSGAARPALRVSRTEPTNRPLRRGVTGLSFSSVKFLE